ncbi:MAG: hypothetical protein Ta2B_08570 [Termitinemataceae bacterium]|nr:MAG: hypothetical protein Ta2B_08570 [Termitinemataceae bacterium]
MSVPSGHDIINKKLFIIFAVCTVIVLTVLLIYPLQFYIYSVVFCFWGLAYILDGKDVSGLILYGLGLAFAYRQGFFRTLQNVKRLAAILIGLVSVGVQYRYGLPVLVNTIIQCVIVFISISLGYMLFLPKLQSVHNNVWFYEREDEQQEINRGVPKLLPDDIEEQDKELLNPILQGNKYEYIASTMNMSVPTLKRKLKDLFLQLDVPNREIFLLRYGKNTDT